jgi:CubicO group peptidase (beta-lactamase class C family)
MRRLSTVFATVLVVGILAQARPPIAASQDVSLLAPSLSAQIDRIALDQIHAGRTPGIAIGVVEDGRIVYARGFGFASL